MLNQHIGPAGPLSPGNCHRLGSIKPNWYRFLLTVKRPKTQASKESFVIFLKNNQVRTTSGKTPVINIDILFTTTLPER